MSLYHPISVSSNAFELLIISREALGATPKCINIPKFLDNDRKFNLASGARKKLLFIRKGKSIKLGYEDHSLESCKTVPSLISAPFTSRVRSVRRSFRHTLQHVVSREDSFRHLSFPFIVCQQCGTRCFNSSSIPSVLLHPVIYPFLTTSLNTILNYKRYFHTYTSSSKMLQ